MYRKFFGLRENQVHPDPRYLVLTRDVREALACVHHQKTVSARVREVVTDLDVAQLQLTSGPPPMSIRDDAHRRNARHI